MSACVTFTRRGFVRGFRMCLPLAVSVFAYGLVFGMLATQVGMYWYEVLLMSLTVFAGASQIIAMDLWADPLHVAPLVITTFVVNIRYLLMGAALQPWFRGLSPLKAYGSVFFCADENWALSMREHYHGEWDAAFLLGSGFAIYCFWVVATVLGFLGGVTVNNPAQFGLDFAFTAAFIALGVGFLQGKHELPSWLVAAVIAILMNHFLPGKWYILIGALAGSGVEVIRHGR